MDEWHTSALGELWYWVAQQTWSRLTMIPTLSALRIAYLQIKSNDLNVIDWSNACALHRARAHSKMWWWHSGFLFSFLASINYARIKVGANWYVQMLTVNQLQIRFYNSHVFGCELSFYFIFFWEGSAGQYKWIQSFWNSSDIFFLLAYKIEFHQLAEQVLFSRQVTGGSSCSIHILIDHFLS